VGWRIPALAFAGLLLVSATAAAGGGRTIAPPLPPLADDAPAAAPMPQALATAPAAPRAGRQPTGIRIDRTWLARTAARAGMPVPALRAYARAQLGAPAGCGLGWTTLAGIGWVESQHGTIGGRSLRPDGRPSAPILGPALDGTGDVAAIRPDESGTALHGDSEWEHAVGPMQFLPSTWATWAADGDADGRADPQDLDDAAAAAAAYLCADGHSLTGGGWSAAVLSYNHDAGYVGLVFAAAQEYADRTAS
jgi:membrane-bound lytic murein transglycosylase B